MASNRGQHSDAGSDRMNDNNIEDLLLLQFTVKYQGSTSENVPVLLPSNIDSTECLPHIRKSLGDWFGLMDPTSNTPTMDIWMVWKGKRLADNDAESAKKLYQLASDKDAKTPPVIFLGGSIKKGAAVSTGASNNDSRNRLNEPVKRAESPPMNPMDAMMMDLLSKNPELMLSLMQMNPQIKSLMDKNPAIRHAMSDPDTLKQMLLASTNSGAQQELMRGQDLALANISNMPGGMQALESFFHSTEADLNDVFLDGSSTLKPSSSASSSAVGSSDTPMPNPWQRSSNPPLSNRQHGSIGPFGIGRKVDIVDRSPSPISVSVTLSGNATEEEEEDSEEKCNCKEKSSCPHAKQ